MKNRAAGILIQEGKILLIHRIKEIEGKIREYYVIPGGGIEEYETIEDAVIREIKEEVGIDVEIIQNKSKYILEEENKIQYFMLVKQLSGEFGTGTGPEFTDESYAKNGKYLIEMVSIEDILNNKINMVPEEIKEQFINDIEKLGKNLNLINSEDLINLNN